MYFWPEAANCLLIQILYRILRIDILYKLPETHTKWTGEFKNSHFIALIHPIQWTIANRSRQTSEKDVLYILPAGPVTECAFARWRMVLHFLFTY